MVRAGNAHSPEQLEIVSWTVRFGVTTAEAIAVHGGWTLASARGRLCAAERAGLLSSRRVLADASPLYTATRAGLRASWVRGLEPCRVSVSAAPHAVACAQVAAALERAYPDHHVTGERELRRDEREAGTALASACLGRAPDGGELLHRPDVVLWPNSPTDGLPVAVEVELTIKAPARLLEICRAWARCRCVAGTLYLATPEVQRPLSRAIERAHAGERIALVGFDALGAGAGAATDVGPNANANANANREYRPKRCVACLRGGQPANQGRPQMSYFSINRVVLVGRLTRDPELRALPSGTSVCGLRIACNSSRKDPSGELIERPNYFDVSVYGAPGESVSRYMHRGSRVAIDGRLEWREWETAEQERRQAVSIVADTVQFLDSAGERAHASDAGNETGEEGERELVGVGLGADEDDLVF